MKRTILFVIWLVNVLLAYGQAPSINSIHPLSGSIGTLLTINGSDLGSAAATISGKQAITISSTASKLIVMVMPGTVSGTIAVSNTRGTTSASTKFAVIPTPAPSVQQGSRLSGTGATGVAGHGSAVAISADGNTVAVGGLKDNSDFGAVWVYVRNGSSWSQQGPKLIPNDATISKNKQIIFGNSVALSADGNTLVAGGPQDIEFGDGWGATWVFVRENGVWTQQGKKLVGSGGLKNPLQGFEVAVSADGNTLASFGLGDDWFRGAAWIFTRTGKTWLQQGSKLVASGLSDIKEQGGGSFHYPMALSADGNTLLFSGATLKSSSKYVSEGIFFTRNNGIWTEQQSRIKHSSGWSGRTLAMSADATTVILGDPKYDNQKGGAWILVKQGSNWVQQGSVLSPPGGESGTSRGSTVALSADGNTAILGEYGLITKSYPGAIWVYKRTGTTWILQGGQLRGADVDAFSLSGSVVAISADGTTSVNAGQSFNNSKGAAWIFAYAPEQSPTVITLPVTDLSFSAVTLNGSVTDHSSQTDVSIEYGSSATLSDAVVAMLTTGTNPMPPGIGTTLFESRLTGLKPQTTYYYRIVALNGGGQASGDILNFTTPARPILPPIATTTPATLVSTTGATLNGTADDNGNETYVAFEWSLSADLSGSHKALIATGPTPLPADAGTTVYSTVLNGLVSNTRYYYRIVGTNASGTSSGQIMSFVTEAIVPPSATTLKATQVFSTTATLNGEVNGHESITDVSFYFSTSPLLNNAVQVPITSGTSPIKPSSGMKQFSALLTTLTPKTTYYYRISATNTGGTSSGAILSFTTRLTEQTDPVLIPNTFTPNNDGINDTWEITGFEATPVFEFNVFNRYGVLVHSSKGTSVSWDGKSKDQPLMIGTYFYIINFVTSKKSFSGAITILR